MTEHPPRVVLLHGFGQTRNCWGRLSDQLSERRDVLALDLPGHGTEFSVSADLWHTADIVAAQIGDQSAALIGYSFGGRVALHTALAHPATIDQLVLVSATAGIDDDNERAKRQESDDALAARIEAIGVDAFVDEWLALPMFAGLPPNGRFVDERRRNTAAGLAMSLRRAGTGTQQPLWYRLEELSMPVLVIAGAHDKKFTAIAEQMAETIGSNATLAVIGCAGHSAHLEQAEMTADLIDAWLREPTL